MSAPLINRSADLKALVADGYEVSIRAGHLVVTGVPYVNARREIKRGALICALDVANDVTVKPSTHVMMFSGEYPCDQNGKPLEKIRHGSGRQELGEGLTVDHSFSSKPKVGDGYPNFHEKVVAYAAIISGPAHALDPNATAQTRRVIMSEDPDSVFNYIDTASSRAGISALSHKLELAKVAIVGLGGTGSYVLDQIAKTLVREIHLFDGDDFFQYNAFRSPGAATPEALKAVPKKVHYWAEKYAPMRRNIFPHPFHLDASNVSHLEGMSFTFICVDKGEAKRPVVEKLEALNVPFIDVGMGLGLVEDKIEGILRVTTSTPQKREHIREKKRFALAGGDADGIYSHNIQVADLNALNAALAVIRWKKLYGYYSDFEREHFSAYTLDGNVIDNDDKHE